MGCNRCGPRQCSCGVQLPYYREACFEQNQRQGVINLYQYSPVLRISTAWAVPEFDQLITLTVSALADVMIGANIYNPEYGEYAIVSYDPEAQSIKVTKVSSPLENGAEIPACSKFIVVANSSSAQIAELQAEIDALELIVTGLQETITGIQSEISTIEGEITTIQLSIGELETAITTLQGQIAVIEGQITAIEDDVTELQIDVTALETALSLSLYGWVAFTLASATYVSATSFTIPGDYTSVFTVGTPIKCTNSGTKYGYVASSSFGGGSTTVNLIANNDYSLANAAITSLQISRGHPADFPVWFNYTPTLTGFGVGQTPTTAIYRFKIFARQVTVNWWQGGTSTSTLTTYTGTLPIQAAVAGGAGWAQAGGQATDSGGALATTPLATIASAGLVVSFFTNGGGSGWTASGTKWVRSIFTYEV